MFSSVVLSSWIPEGLPDAVEDAFIVVVDAAPTGGRSVSLLTAVDGPRLLTLTPDRAVQLSLAGGDTVSPGDLSAALSTAGIELNGADHVFYTAADAHSMLLDDPVTGATRRLTPADSEAFARFAEDAPEDDMDEAFVELDHWLAFGTFEGDRLVAAASMYPWGGTRLADLGVLTLPAHRGRGFGRSTVRAMSAHALRLGYEPQYRCQLDNAPSVALAAAAGFARFGEWDVIADDDYRVSPLLPSRACLTREGSDDLAPATSETPPPPMSQGVGVQTAQTRQRCDTP